MFVLEVNNQTQTKVDKKWLEGVVQICRKVLKIHKSQAISLAFVTPLVIKKINLAYRGKNEVTDVLSFEEDGSESLGEIIICLARAKQRAKVAGWPLKNEVAKLLIHGYLHLMGYDHEKSVSVAYKMESLEKRILNKFVSMKYKSAIGCGIDARFGKR
ncbi:rRNA maturation RNase YbeY [Candidatus Falkowbacteria bacterium]|nr:rRNA maturation RNase YbeY [Candidatus Falkowbacteria bacterium]